MDKPQGWENEADARDVESWSEPKHEEVREAAEAVAEALDALSIALGNDRDVYDALRGYGRSEELGQPPYELRNLLPDLEGREGGWLQGKGESFREAIAELIGFVGGEKPEDEEDGS